MSVFKSEAGGVDAEGPVRSTGFEILWRRASNSTARMYGSTVEQVETKLSNKDFNKYLSKL